MGWKMIFNTLRKRRLSPFKKQSFISWTDDRLVGMCLLAYPVVRVDEGSILPGGYLSKVVAKNDLFRQLALRSKGFAPWGRLSEIAETNS
jgi:hypothetical protein